MFPSLDHDEKVVIRIIMTELVMILQSDPHVGTQVKLPIVSEILGQRNIWQQLREALSHGGHCQVR